MTSTNSKLEDEARMRILQALSIAPRLTMGMLQAHLTSRIKNHVRNAVLAKMAARKEILVRDFQIASPRGTRSTIKVVELLPSDVEMAA